MTWYWWQPQTTSCSWTLTTRYLESLLLPYIPQESAKLRQYGSGAILSCASDGVWAVAATSRCLLLWHLHTEDCVRTLKSGTVQSLGAPPSSPRPSGDSAGLPAVLRGGSRGPGTLRFLA